MKLLILGILGIVGLFLIFNVPVLYDTIGNRVASMLAGYTGGGTAVDESTEDRILLTRWGIEWFKQRPLLGWGIDNYRIVLTTFHPNYPISYYAHNNYVELLVDVGVVGTLVYYYIHVKCMKSALKMRKHLTLEQFFFAGILFTIVLCDVGIVSYFDKYLQVILLGCWQVLTDKHFTNQGRSHNISLTGSDPQS